jgi:hypothetical protein
VSCAFLRSRSSSSENFAATGENIVLNAGTEVQIVRTGHVLFEAQTKALLYAAVADACAASPKEPEKATVSTKQHPERNVLGNVWAFIGEAWTSKWP